MKRLIKLAERIKDKELREKTIGLLTDFRLSNKNFRKYVPESIEKAGSMFGVSSSGLGPVERDVIEHSITLTELCLKAAEIFKKNYNLELNEDFLIASSILHDLMKAYEYKRDDDGELESTGIMLDHTMLATAELFARDFPEEVIHIVASHFGESGPTSPRSFEALIFHHLDSFLSVVEYYDRGKKELEKKIQMYKKAYLEKVGEEAEESR